MTSRSSNRRLFCYSKLVQTWAHHTHSFQKSLLSTLNTAKADKMCRNANLVYQKLMWVNQAKHQVLTDKHKQDYAVCNLCADTKPLFLLKLNTDLGNNSVNLKF